MFVHFLESKPKVIKSKIIYLFLLFPFYLSGSDGVELLKDSVPVYQGYQKAYALYRLGHYYFTSNNDSAMFYFENALKEYSKIDDEKGIINCYGMLANIFNDYGMYDTSIALNFKVIDWGKKHNDIRTFIAYLGLGNTYKDIGQLDKAKTFYMKAIRGDYLPAKTAAFANMGLIYLNNDEFDSASYYFNGALQEYYTSDTSQRLNQFNIATILLNLASVAYGKGEYEKGIRLLFKSLDIARKIDSKRLLAKIFLNLGEGYYHLQQENVSLRYYLKAKKIADSLGANEIREEVFRTMSDYYHEQGDYEKAYFNLTEYHKIHDSLIIEGYKSSIAEMEVKYSVREKIARINTLKKKEQMIIGLFVSIVMGIILIGLIVILLLNRHRLKLKYARNQAEARSEMEKMKTKVAEEKLEKIITSLHEKSAFIEELEQEIEKLSINTEKENIEEKIRKLRKTRILTDDDWEEYYRVFNEIHPLFFSSIKNYRDLSVGDKRQLIFLKLGLTLKEIAFLMGISPEGVKRARQRLAKKIGLNDASELKEFIERL